jgi:transposase
MRDKRRKATPPGSEPPAAETPELPERWSVQRKTELVLRLMRGEALDAVSRESQVPAHELENWKRVFLETGTRGLKTRSDPEERELTLARAKTGELMMRLELAEYLIEKRGLTDEWNGDSRTIPMTETLRAAIVELPRPLATAAPVLPQLGPWVLTRSFARLVRRLGIKNLTFHDLRHDAASTRAMEGVPLRTIAEILEHRDLRMTARYAHLSPQHLRDAMRALDRRSEPMPNGTISAPALEERRISNGGLDGT